LKEIEEDLQNEDENINNSSLKVICDFIIDIADIKEKLAELKKDITRLEQSLEMEKLALGENDIGNKLD